VVGSGDSFVNHYLPCFRLQITCRLLPADNCCRLCLFKVRVGNCPSLFSGGESYKLAAVAGFVYLKLMWETALPTSPQCARHPTHFAICPFQFLVYYSIFFPGWRSDCPGDYVGFSQEWLWGYHGCLFAHLLVCVSQAGQEPMSCGVGALLVSQCSVA
jgi:hypothetical protein